MCVHILEDVQDDAKEENDQNSGDPVERSERKRKIVQRFKDRLYRDFREALKGREYVGIRCMFTHHMSVLGSEAVVESAGKTFEKAYSPEKRKTKTVKVSDGMQCRLTMPWECTKRDVIIDDVTDEYKVDFKGYQFIKTKSYKKNTRKAHASPPLDRMMLADDESVFTV